MNILKSAIKTNNNALKLGLTLISSAKTEEDAKKIIVILEKHLPHIIDTFKGIEADVIDAGDEAVEEYNELRDTVKEVKKVIDENK